MKYQQSEYEGETYISGVPEVIKHHKDVKSTYFKDHQARFDYILFKFIDRTNGMENLFPDSNQIHQQFCEKVVSTSDIQNYFTNLTPEKYVKWTSVKDTFSIDEMMLIASRFFYCDYIDKADTTISSHVCVGINGQKEFSNKRDYTILEAFAVEGIMSYFTNKDPKFYMDFYVYYSKLSKEKRPEFVDFDSYLMYIRKQTFDFMAKNEDLKNKLLKYYSKNKNNVNFVIV